MTNRDEEIEHIIELLDTAVIDSRQSAKLVQYIRQLQQHGGGMGWISWETLAQQALGIAERAVAVAEKREARMQEVHDAKLAGVAFEVDDGKEVRGRRNGSRTKTSTKAPTAIDMRGLGGSVGPNDDWGV